VVHDDPIFGKVIMDRLPIEFEKTPCEIYRPAKPVGTDNADVLGDWLGTSEDEVRKGEKEGYLA